MGVTIIGGGGGGSSSDDFGLPKFTGRFRNHSPSSTPTSFVSGSSFAYSSAGFTANKPNMALAPLGNPKEFAELNIGTHTGSVVYRPAGGSNNSHAVSEINAGAAHWLGGMWLTSGNILWAATDAARTIYIREYDTTNLTFISNGVNIVATNSGHSGSASSNENSNKFGVLPDGTYYTGRNGYFDFINPSGTIIHTARFSSTQIPVNLYDSVSFRDLGLIVQRRGHPTKPDAYYTGYNSQGGSFLQDFRFQSFDGTWNGSSGGSVYDGYVALTERYEFHQGDMSDWVSSVLDIVSGENT